MKNNVKSLVLSIAFLCLSYCGIDNESVISGIVRNLDAQEIKINSQTINLDNSGRFNFAFQLDKSKYITLNFGKEIFLYLKPGDNVTVDIDVKAELNSIKISGGQEEINQHLLQQSSQSLKVNEYLGKNFRNIVKMEENDYVAKMNELWKPFTDQLDAFIKEKKLKDDYFIKIQRAGILYSWADILIRYPGWSRQFGGDPSYAPSETFYKFVEKLDLNDPELLEEEAYKTFLDDYFNLRTDELLKTTTEFDGMNYKRFRIQMKLAVEMFNDPTVRSEMIYPVINSLVANYQHKNIDDLIETFKHYCTNPDYIEEVEKLIQKDQDIQESCEIQTYKTIDDKDLEVYIYKPADFEKGDPRPALGFFHGGGWECGKPEWGHMQCEHFSSLGMLAFSFEYRLLTQHDATPIEGLKDTKSAIRWIREHAEEFNVDPDKIIGSGYSAGGHLIMCTAMVDGYDESSDDLSIDPAVNAMLLWVTPAVVYPGWFTSLLRGRAELKEFNPVELIKPGLPPAIFFQGTADDTVPYKSVVEYVGKCRAAGNRCELEVYEGQTHLNWGENNQDVLKKMGIFLKSIGFL